MWCAERTLLALEIMENSGLGITRTLQITPGTDREAQPLQPHGSQMAAQRVDPINSL